MLELIQVSTKNISSDISYTKYSSDLNLGEGLFICTSFHFPDSGLYLLHGFDFEWSATENQPYVIAKSSRSFKGSAVRIKENKVKKKKWSKK